MLYIRNGKEVESKTNKLSNKDFLNKIDKRYLEKFQVLTKYTHSNNPIELRCLKHYKTFKTKPLNLYKFKETLGCEDCGKENRKKVAQLKITKKQRGFEKLSTEKVLARFESQWGKIYSYEKFQYINSKTPSIITCPKHGDFEMSYSEHYLSKMKCPKCVSKRPLRSTTEEFVKKAEKVHNKKYSYAKTVYRGARYKLIITCPKHGDFEQEASHHLRGEGCPLCRNSRGEGIIQSLLIKKNLDFIREKRFSDCKSSESGKLYSFDFFIPSYNLIIEFNGEQHYYLPKNSKAFDYSKESLKKTQKRDKEKREYCLSKNLNFAIIRFDEVDFEKSLEELFQKIKTEGKVFRVV